MARVRFPESALFDTPHSHKIGCVFVLESTYQLQAALAQLGERQTEDLKVPGSIPGGGIFSVVSIYGLVGYDVCLTRRRSPVRSWVDVFLARCSPRGVMETRLPPKEKIVGSSPTGGVPKVLWCNWLALRTLNPAIRVQIPVGPFVSAPVA